MWAYADIGIPSMSDFGCYPLPYSIIVKFQPDITEMELFHKDSRSALESEALDFN